MSWRKAKRGGRAGLRLGALTESLLVHTLLILALWILEPLAGVEEMIQDVLIERKQKNLAAAIRPATTAPATTAPLHPASF